MTKRRKTSNGQGFLPKKFILKGTEMPWWWPHHPVTREPLHKLFRAMSEELNEIYPVLGRPDS